MMAKFCEMACFTGSWEALNMRVVRLAAPVLHTHSAVPHETLTHDSPAPQSAPLPGAVGISFHCAPSARVGIPSNSG